MCVVAVSPKLEQSDSFCYLKFPFTLNVDHDFELLRLKVEGRRYVI